MAGTSGVQRALRFSQYLPEFGWEPIVLTARACAYERTSVDQMVDVPQTIHLRRAFALDAARHLAFFGRYPKLLAVPDRWMSWWWAAVPLGMQMVKRFRPHGIWSTFPIPTAHRIGLSLRKRSGLPWIADFRDVMTEDGYPVDPLLAREWQALERETVDHCARAVFTTAGAAALYSQRYPRVNRERFAVIENGYDEQLFAALEPSAQPGQCASHRPLRLVHSGVVYPSERDPTELFAALHDLRVARKVDANSLRLVLRATGHDRHIGALITQFGLNDMVELAPSLPYREALEEMLAADALLLLQGANCNRQIPAKLYEYLRSGRPVLGLANGDTASALKAAGIDIVVPLESRAAIADALTRFLFLVRQGRAPCPSPDAVQRHSRRAKTQQLAEILNATCQ
jgi:glycosyltransferase involved in cell wall biosynthesis